MNSWPIVLKNGDHNNITKAGILFDKYGTKTQEKIIYCDSWKQGFLEAKKQGYTEALFVDSGTVIIDWKSFKNIIQTYPSRDLIAHLIWQADSFPKIHDQCWFANLQIFDENDFDPLDIDCPIPIRSDRNLHEDYTPLWIKPGKKRVSFKSEFFGQNLIAKQLDRGQGVLNWNNSIRELKYFLYRDTDWKQNCNIWFNEYINLSESQLWILNNEDIDVVDVSSMLTPGSGLFWMMNFISQRLTELQIVDISHIQTKFCQTLIEQWDGDDYGSFAWDFIQNNRLSHYEIDQANLSDLSRLKLRSKTYFVDHVNNFFNCTIEKFDIRDFKARWNQARQNKKITVCQGDLIDWVLDGKSKNIEYIWKSNILSYKWTMLHNTENKIKKFIEMTSS